jgi:hypothetical protein
MNINKIIKEETDGLDWIREIPIIDLTSGKWVIRNNKSNNIEENRNIQEFLYSIGYRWTFNFPIEEMVDTDHLYYFDETNPLDNNDRGRMVFDSYLCENKIIESLINEKGFILYDWDFIKRIYSI